MSRLVAAKERYRVAVAQYLTLYNAIAEDPEVQLTQEGAPGPPRPIAWKRVRMSTRSRRKPVRKMSSLSSAGRGVFKGNGKEEARVLPPDDGEEEIDLAQKLAGGEVEEMYW